MHSILVIDPVYDPYSFICSNFPPMRYTQFETEKIKNRFEAW